MPRTRTVAAWMTSLVLATNAASASNTCTVRGKLLGSDGKAMRGSFLRPLGGPNRLLPVRADGSFSMTFPRAGGYWLWLGGVHHRTLLMPLLLKSDGRLELEVRLAAAEIRTRLDSVRVIGDFNDYSQEGAVPMLERADGTFVATVDCKRDSLRYQLLGVQAGELPICGTQADTFLFDWKHRMLYGGQSGKFVAAVAARGGPVEIIFDPSRLPRSAPEPMVRFRDSKSDAAAVFAIQQDLESRGRKAMAALSAYQAAGGDPASFRIDYSKDLSAIASQLAAERRPIRRQLLLFEYFGLASSDTDSILARTALHEIPSNSAAWSLVWGDPGSVLFKIEHAARRPAEVRAYVDRAIASHPDSSIRAAFLHHALGLAKADGDERRFDRCYRQLVERYGGTAWAARARREYGPDRAIQKGNAVPEVAFSGLKDSTLALHPADFRGRWLLLDFWATWCGPCVAEMASIHDVHEKYKNRGLAILSISLDRKRGDVVTFRAKRWKMPWSHAFAPGGAQATAVKPFQVGSIPYPILVDPSGKVAAVGAELRGANLDALLSNLLAHPPDQAH